MRVPRRVYQRRVSQTQTHHRQVVAERVKASRLALGMSCRQFAEALGVSKREVNYLEAGRHQPGLVTLAKLVEVTGRDLAYFAALEAKRPEVLGV